MKDWQKTALLLCALLFVAFFSLKFNYKPQIGNVPPPAGGMTVANWPAILDPCQSMSIAKSSVPIDVTSAATTQLVAPSASTVVYVCGYQLTMAATIAADSAKFTSGTGATCGGSSIDETGTISSGILTSGATSVSAGWDATVFASAAGSGVCLVSTVGTGPRIAGVLSYIQQ